MGNHPPTPNKRAVHVENARKHESEKRSVIEQNVSEASPLLPVFKSAERKDFESVKEVREAYRDLIKEENSLHGVRMTGFYGLQGLLWAGLSLSWVRGGVWYFALFLSVLGVVGSLAFWYMMWLATLAINEQQEEWESYVGSEYKGPGIVGLPRKKLKDKCFFLRCCPWMIKPWCRPVPMTFALAWIGVFVITIVKREDLN